AEAGVDPSHGELRGEVFLFGSHEAGAWRVDGNLGLEQESREASLVYAWRVQRTLGLRWAAAVEGGGGGGFGGEREHFAGATLSTELEKPAIELRLGCLFDLKSGAHLTRVGFALPLWDPRRSAAQSLARERDRG
uniref:hypothetical protein n=1 Tax=uncultured Phenylobacterium sp. TaxID=349273 RepID=UPI0025FC929E